MANVTTPQRRARTCLSIVVAVVLSVLGTIYTGRGLEQLVMTSSSTEAKDLRTNWEELRVVLARENPYETDTPSPYPPFTYPANVILLWPPWPVVRLYFALLNLICLGFLMVWAYRVARPRDAGFAVGLAVSIPAASAVA